MLAKTNTKIEDLTIECTELRTKQAIEEVLLTEQARSSENEHGAAERLKEQVTQLSNMNACMLFLLNLSDFSGGSLENVIITANEVLSHYPGRITPFDSSVL